MVTAEQILTKNGQMIVDKGVTLTRPLIMRLSFYCVLEVGIEAVSYTHLRHRHQRAHVILTKQCRDILVFVIVAADL